MAPVGLISGLATFLMLSGFLEKRLVPLSIALLVGFTHGSALVIGIIPEWLPSFLGRPPLQRNRQRNCGNRVVPGRGQGRTIRTAPHLVRLIAPVSIN